MASIGRQAVSKQDRVEESPADRIVVETRTDDDDEFENYGQQRQRRDQQRARIVHDAAGPSADALEPDRHRQSGIDVKRDFGDPEIRSVNIATGDVMADLENHEQHGEQNGAGIDDASRQIVGAPPQ